jgi:hypothetical protein
MRTPRRRSHFPFFALGSVLLLQALLTGCSNDEGKGPGGSPPQVVGLAEPSSASTGPAITRAGVNPPSGGSFTCWIKGSGFQDGDKVVVNGTTEIATTFGSPELVTFAGPVELLEQRTGLSLVVVRPGTKLRSNPVDAPVFSAPPKG